MLPRVGGNVTFVCKQGGSIGSVCVREWGGGWGRP